MTWLRRHRLSAAEALELELAGIVTDSAAAELLPVTDLLRAAARGLPPPTALRPRRRELVALGASAAAVGRPTARVGRLMRAPMIALAVAIIAVASVLGSTLVTSWLHLIPPPISVPASVPDPSTGSPDGAWPGATDPSPAALPDDLAAELLAKLQAACGEEATLPDLSGLDEAEARALVDALIAECELVPGTPVPGTPVPGTPVPGTPVPDETPAALPDDLAAELLAELQAACGEHAALPDLSGLGEAEARALVDALIAACELVPGTLLP